MGLVTLNQVKYYLNIPSSEYGQDEFFEGSEDGTVMGLIDLVSSAMEGDCGIDIETHEREQILDGSGKDYQPLEYWPIESIVGADNAAKLANIQYRDGATDAWQNLLDDYDYVSIDTDRPWALWLLDGETFPEGTKNIRVNCVTGHSEVPSDVMLAVLERIAIKYRESNRGGNRLGQTGTGISGGFSVSESYNDLQSRWDAIVKKYGRKM